MNQTIANPEPRTQHSKALLLAGCSEHYAYDRRGEIPAQWQRFAPLIGKIHGQIGHIAYGVCTNNNDNRSFEYLSAVEVTDTAGLDKDLTVLQLPARNYAVFMHTGNVSTLHNTLDQIWQHWARQHGERIARAPFFERYGETFDPTTGNGGVEIWIPLI